MNVVQERCMMSVSIPSGVHPSHPADRDLHLVWAAVAALLVAFVLPCSPVKG